jgi:hypothetical protein
MYLYRYPPYVTQGVELPQFALEDGVYDVNNASTISLNVLEQIWEKRHQLVFVFHYVDNTDVYYLIKDKKDINLEEINIPEPRHHCDMYCMPLFEQLIERLQRRIHTRELIRRSKYLIGDCEYIPSYQSRLLDELLNLVQNNDTDHHLLQDMIKETQDNIDTERRFRPGEEGYHEAKRDYECIIEIDENEHVVVYV